jgi:hypothetical protein
MASKSTKTDTISRSEAISMGRRALRDLDPLIEYGTVVGRPLRWQGTPRQHETTHDIDLLVIPKRNASVPVLGKPFDVYQTSRKHFEPQLVHWLSGKGVIHLKRAAREKGWKMTRYGLERPGKSTLTKAPEIYKALGAKMPEHIQTAVSRFRMEKRGGFERGFIGEADSLVKVGALPPPIGRRISEAVTPKLLAFLKKSGLGKKMGEIENLILAKTRGGRPKHLLERIPPSWLRTRLGARKAIRGLKRGGPTSYAVGKALERPSKGALAGGLIGGLIGLPAPPGIPAAMILAPTGAVAGSLPQILKYRRQRMQSLPYRFRLRAREMKAKGEGAVRKGKESLREAVSKIRESMKKRLSK